MKRRKWSSEQKLKIVLEGLSGQNEISKLYNKYQISQPLYYHWREQLLHFGHQAFKAKNITKKEKRSQNENQQIKQIIGDLTIELRKGIIYHERMIRTIKEDIIWPYDWDNPCDFQRALGKWIDNYNQDFSHQALGYRTPCEHYQNYVKNKE